MASSQTGGGNSPSLPPTPKGGGGPYLAIAGLFVVGIAVLLGLKFCGKSDEAPTPTPPPMPSVPPPATTPDSRLDDIPPPVVEEDAGAPTPATTKPAGFAGNPDCNRSHKCNGQATPELETALAVRAKQARRCYEQALKDDPNLKGRMQATIRIASNGQVCSSTIDSSEIPVITGCVDRVFRVSGSFPAPKGGCVDAKVPMQFVPQR
jgi:hypothetical protein